MKRSGKQSGVQLDFTRAPKLTATRRRWLREQVQAGRFASLDEALNHCIGETLKMEAAGAEFDRKLARGGEGPFRPVDHAWWKTVRSKVNARRTSRRKSA